MSAVWNSLKVCETDATHAICNICKGKVRRGGNKPTSFNTTNLIRHLKKEHTEEHGDSAESEKKKAEKTPTRPLLQRTIESTQTYNPNGEKAKGITRKVMEFIGLDDQPFSVVEDVGFQRLLAHVEPCYVLPGRQYFADVALPALHQDVYTHIETLLKANVSSISFTSDI